MVKEQFHQIWRQKQTSPKIIQWKKNTKIEIIIVLRVTNNKVGTRKTKNKKEKKKQLHQNSF